MPDVVFDVTVPLGSDFFGCGYFLECHVFFCQVSRFFFSLQINLPIIFYICFPNRRACVVYTCMCDEYHLCDNQIVRIKSFSSNTAGDVQAAVDRFKSKGVSRIVVDLRGNVGGLLPAGIDTAGLFLDAGKVRERSVLL